VELSRRLPEAVLLPILQFREQVEITPGADALGFIFPQYGGDLPRVVEKFIQHVDPRAAGYLFAVATRGGTACHAFKTLDRILSARGRRLDAFFVLTMPSGSEPLVENYSRLITPERIARLEGEMLARMDSIAQVIAAREEHRSEDLRAVNLNPPAFLKPLAPLADSIGSLLRPLAKAAEVNFSFYADGKCDGCGLCEKICLSGKIGMAGGRPSWRKDTACLGCFACLNYCPRESVQVRSSWYLKSLTPANGRYHHPAVSAAEIASQKGENSSRPGKAGREGSR